MPKVHNPSEQEVIIVEDETLREGFTQIPNAILRRSDVSPGAKLTYMVLLSYAWQRNSCFPGQDRLAEDMGVGRRSIVTYLQQLQQAGLLRIKRRGLGQTNVYTLPRVTDPRSAKFAHQEVQDSTHQEVQNLHLEEDSEEEDSERKIYLSKIRKAKSEKNDYVNPISAAPNPYTVERQQAMKPREGHPQEHPGGRVGGNKRLSVGIPPDATQQTPPKPQVSHPGPDRETPHKPTPEKAPGLMSIGDILQQQGIPKAVTDDEAYSDIYDYIRDMAGKHHDEASLKSSATRAFNLYRRAGVSLSYFFNVFYDADKEAGRRSGSIKKKTADGFTNRMPYIFAYMEDKLGLRDKPPQRRPQRAQDGEEG